MEGLFCGLWGRRPQNPRFAAGWRMGLDGRGGDGVRVAVVASGAAEEARAALRDGWEIRPTKAGDGAEAVDAAARLPIEACVIDVATGPGLAAAVVRLQIARPACRIVVLAAGRQPGDPEVGALVAAGVYDIAATAEELPAIMAREPGTIADAVGWLPGALRDPQVVTRTVTQTVVQERERLVTAPMASHPAVVAVVGLCGGCGATTTAAAVAGWLVRQGQGVVLVGRGPVHMAVATGADFLDDLLAMRPALALPDRDQAVADLAGWAVGQRRWPWVVVDAGVVGGAPIPGSTRATWVWPDAVAGADVTILVVPREPWRIGEAVEGWGEYTRQQGVGDARVAVRWHPRDGAAGLRQPMEVLVGGGTALAMPDVTAAMAVGWPLGAAAADPALDRASKALLAPLADHLGASRRGRP